MTDGCKAALDRVAGANALPVLCRKVIKGQQFLAILLQTKRGFWKFFLMAFNEQIKGFFRLLFAFGLPDIVGPIFFQTQEAGV